MSLIPTELRCDARGCGHSYFYALADTATELREHAAKSGWTADFDEDYCPDHADEAA